MWDEIKNISTEKSDLRKFGVTIGIILIVVSGFLFYKEKESYQVFVGVGIVLITFGIISPTILKSIYLIWMIFASILGWVMTRLILSLLFYIIITPIGLLFRLFGKELLKLKNNNSDTSYWSPVGYGIEKNQDYEKQF